MGDGSWQMPCSQKVLLAPLMETRLHLASRQVGNRCTKEMQMNLSWSKKGGWEVEKVGVGAQGCELEGGFSL